MGRNTLILIFSLSAAMLGLVLVSDNAKNKELAKLTAERNTKEVLNTLIAATMGRHPLINESLRGKIVVLNVWATWCGPCLKEIPELNKLATDFAGDKVVFIALDEEDVVKESKAMIDAQLDFKYHLSFDEKQLINVLASFQLPSDANAIPMNVVLNPQGKVEYFYTGNQPEKLEQVRAYLTTATKSI